MRGLKLLQVFRRGVHVLFPALVERRVGRDQLLPLVVGELAVHAAAPARAGLAGLVFGGAEHVPAQVDDGPGSGLLLRLLDHEIAMEDGVLVLVVRESEIRPPDGGILAGDGVDLVVVLGTLVRIVMLAGEDALTRDRAEGLQQRAGLQRGVGIHRLALVRRRRGRPGKRWRLLGRGNDLGEGECGRAEHDAQRGEYGLPHVDSPSERDGNTSSAACCLSTRSPLAFVRASGIPVSRRQKAWTALPPRWTAAHPSVLGGQERKLGG